MEAKTNYTIVGLVVLILIGALISAALWLSVGFNQKTYNFYTVYLHESVSGLSEESPVKYNGVQVGFVKKIRLNKNDPRLVELILSIESGTPITTSTFATLISQGITGVTYVGLSAGSSELTPIRTMPGEPYPVIPAKPSLFNQLDAILKEVSDSVNKVSTQMQRIFNEKNAHYIRHSLANMDKISTELAGKRKKLGRTIDNADVFLANMAKVSKDVPGIIKNLSNDMSLAGQNISKTMIAGRNTIDEISQETIPSFMTLLRRLNSIAANLEEVSSDMRQNPGVIVRGVKPPKPGPGE